MSPEKVDLNLEMSGLFSTFWPFSWGASWPKTTFSSHVLALTLFRTCVNLSLLPSFVPSVCISGFSFVIRESYRVTNMQMKGNSDLDHDFKINLSRLHDYINVNLIRSKVTDLKTYLFASSAPVGRQHHERTHSTKWSVLFWDQYFYFRDFHSYWRIFKQWYFYFQWKGEETKT